MSRRNTVISDLTYTFDGAGRKTKETNVVTNASIQYTYDKAGRLTSVKDVSGTVTYAYDSNGNLISKTDVLGTTSYVYNKANQLLNMTTPTGKVTTYTYDANGNLIKETNGTSTTTYSYNYEGKLIKEVQPDGSVITYGYDGEGRRISKTVKGVTTRFYYDGNQIAKEVSASGTTLAEYLYGFGGSPIAMIRDGHTYSYIFNGHGDTIALADENQAIVMTYRYDPFGKVTATGFIVNPFQYGGQYGVYHDSETGLDFMQIRYYNSALGRFITPDTFPGLLENPISQNAYLYANGDPINNVDPDGHSAWSWGKVWNSVKSVARTVVNKVTSVVKSAVSWVKSTWSSAKSWVKQTWSKAKSTVKKTYQTARSTAQTAWKQSVDYAKQRAEEMKRAAERAAEEARQRWENTKRMLTQMKEESKKITQSIIDQATKAAKEEVQAAKETAKAKMMSMAQAAGKAADKVLAVGSQVLRDGMKIVGGLGEMLDGAVVSIINPNLGGTMLKQGYDDFKKGLDTKTGRYLVAAGKVVGGIAEAMTGAAIAVGGAETGAGIVFGGILFVHGLSTAYSGLNDLYFTATNQDEKFGSVDPFRGTATALLGDKLGNTVATSMDIASIFFGGGAIAKGFGKLDKIEGVITQVPTFINGVKSGMKSLMEGSSGPKLAVATAQGERASSQIMNFASDASSEVETMSQIAKTTKGKAPVSSRNSQVDEIGEGTSSARNGEIATEGARYGNRRISDELYAELRNSTPTPELRDKVNEGIELPMADPALPGKEITSRLEADHIVSMDKITRMEGFDKLTKEQQLALLNYEENFTGLSKSANTSKGSKSFEEWTMYKKENIPVDPVFRDQMIGKEKDLEIKLQQMIDYLLKK